MQRNHLLISAVLLVTVCPGSVFAHKVGVSCTVRDDTVEVEAYYEDDTPAIKAKVHVLNAQEYFVAIGTTDEKGRWIFAKPAPGTYKILLDAGAGHRAQAKLVVPGLVNDPAPEEQTSPPGNSEREEFTQVPWLNIVIGLIVIAGGCAMFLLVSRFRSGAPAHSSETNG